MTETWIEEKNWKRLETQLPNGFRWICQYATRENKKGRARGGILTGVKEELPELSNHQLLLDENQGQGGMVERRIKIKGEEWRICTAYCSGKVKEALVKLNEGISENPGEKTIIGGDFNSRIGKEGQIHTDDENEYHRNSKDSSRNAEGDILLKIVENRGWHFLNGNITGDERGEFTYIGARGASVIDYVIANSEAIDKITQFRIDDKIDSDHLPLTVELETEVKASSAKENKKEVNIWNEESIETFTQRTADTSYKEGNVFEVWIDLKTQLDECAMKKSIQIKQEIGFRKWWDKECKQGKRNVKKLYLKWKDGSGTRENYLKGRQEFRKLCTEKEENYKEQEIKSIKALKSETEIWKYINKGRKTRTTCSKDITTRKFKEHFMNILEGSEEEKGGSRRAVLNTEEDEKDLEVDEIDKQIKKLKKKKATGTDGIQNEHWIYCSEKAKTKLREIIMRVWKGEGFPEDWRDCVITPIYKKGDPNEVGNYRGISLLNTAYKIYAAIINERLKKDIEGKGILPDGQAGFRKCRSTIDNVYILQHAVEMELLKKKGKLFAFFMDLKAAFDKVPRELLWKVMEQRGVRRGLIERIKEVYETTRNVVRANGESTAFWTTSGIRQGCPLSPTLFTIFISDLEEYLAKAQSGGVVIGRKKFWSLAYADDVVAVATTEKELREMISRLIQYFDRRELVLNVEKSKILKFSKGGGRRRKTYESWKWKNHDIEEVTEFKYLGYIFTKNGDHARQVRELAKKGMVAAKRVWGLAEKKFKDDCKRRLWLFEYLILSVMTYGAELFGWKEWAILERVQTTYVKWTLGLQRCTPDYMVLDEAKRDRIKIKTGKRAIRYELLAAKREGKELLQECIKQRISAKGKSKQCKEREKYLNGNGFSQEELDRRIEMNKDVVEELVKREQEVQEQLRYNRIAQSKFNPRFMSCRTFTTPVYLRKSGYRDSQKLIARARCGNLEEGSKYWLKEAEMLCELCGEERGTLEHLVESCKELPREGPSVSDIVKEEDSESVINWIRTVEKKKSELRKKLHNLSNLVKSL